MPQPAPVFEQLLALPRAQALEALAQDAWDGMRGMLGAILSADAALIDLSARLVMPDEITTEFDDPHFVVPIGLDGASAPSALVVLGTAVTARFVDAPAREPGEEGDGSQAVAMAATIAGQLVQAVNATTLSDAPGGITLAPGEIVADGMRASLDAIDEPCILLEGLLNAGRALPFRFVLPASFLEALASVAAELTGGTDVAPPATGPSATLPQETSLDDSPAPLREPTPIMAAPTAQRAQFSPLIDQSLAHSPANIDLLSDLQMSVSVELGRTEMSVADVLALGSGSVIELDRLAGEPVDILVNERLIARGEVVVVDENFGVRIVEVLPRSREAGKAS